LGVAVSVTATPGGYEPALQVPLLAGAGVATVPPVPGFTVSEKHWAKRHVMEVVLAGMVNVTGLAVLAMPPVQSRNVVPELTVTLAVTGAPTGQRPAAHVWLHVLVGFSRTLEVVPVLTEAIVSCKHATNVAVTVAELAGMLKASGLVVPLAPPLHVRKVDRVPSLAGVRATTSPVTKDPAAHARLLVGFAVTDPAVPAVGRLSA